MLEAGCALRERPTERGTRHPAQQRENRLELPVLPLLPDLAGQHVVVLQRPLAELALLVEIGRRESTGRRGVHGGNAVVQAGIEHLPHRPEDFRTGIGVIEQTLEGTEAAALILQPPPASPLEKLEDVAPYASEVSGDGLLGIGLIEELGHDASLTN